MVSGPTSQAVGRLLKEEEDEEIAVLLISIADSDGAVLAMLGCFMDKRSLQKHSKLSKAFERLEGFRMYYAIGASVSSLHRESTDSLICIDV